MKNQAEMPRKLGIIAGGGTLPGKVAAAAKAAGRGVFIVGLEGFADRNVLAPWPHEVRRLGAAARIIAALRENGCQDLVMIGPVRRPSLLDLRPDAEGAKLLARVGRAAFAGDDGLLAAVIRVLTEEGFRVIGMHEIMREAVAPAGLLTRTGPDAQAMTDIRRDVPDGKYTLSFVGYGEEEDHTLIELTYNYGTEKYDMGTAFGHLAVGVPDVYATTETLRGLGAKVTREPGPVKFGTTVIAFVEDPDGYKIELVQRA